MTAEDLFDIYQRQLEWIDRRLKPDTLEFYGDEARDWTYAKEVAFNMYQDLRHFVEGAAPKCGECLFYDKDLVKDEKPYVNENGYEFPAIGLLKYRGSEYVIYNDDYGMSSFIVLDGKPLQVDSFGGETDWYYMIDMHVDHINEIKK